MFAEHQFRLGSPVNDKETLRDQLEAVWRITGKEPEELKSPAELDELFYECWSWFLRLHSKRANTGFSECPLSYSEIESFFNLQQYSPSLWEVMMIEEFDNVAIRVIREEAKKKQDIQKAKTSGKRR